jgi:hypothetical protein
MLLSRRLSGFVLLAGAFQWLVWPTFLRVVWRDSRAFDGGAPTAFLLVHVAIVVPALLIGTGLPVPASRPSLARTVNPHSGSCGRVSRDGRSALA